MTQCGPLPNRRFKWRRAVSDCAGRRVRQRDAVPSRNPYAQPPTGRSDIAEPLWREGWDLKVFGYINMTRTVYGQMKARGGGVIVHVCGTAGNQPTSDHVPATTANSALSTLTRAVGGNSLDADIRVVGINPGDMTNERSEMFLRRYAEKYLGDESRWEEMIADLPGGRAGT